MMCRSRRRRSRPSPFSPVYTHTFGLKENIEWEKQIQNSYVVCVCNWYRIEVYDVRMFG